MKNIILAALVTLMTAPAFAFDTPDLADDQTAVAEDQAQAPDQNFTPAEEDGVDAQAMRPPHWGNWTCYARNVLGQTFWGRSWNRGQAVRMAIGTCHRYSRFPLGRSCRLIGCRGGHF